VSFYQQISSYYDEIFPVAPAAEAFFLKRFQENGSASASVLDVACGSGGYVKAFLDKGYDAFGIDLDEAMVEQARRKTSRDRILQGDMTKVKDAFQRSFDFVMCIGNSLVHLQDENTMLKALQSFYELLNPGGMLGLQIINYDRILSQGIESLPTIERPDAGLTFVRKYQYDQKSGKIHFRTVLTVPDGTFENSIPLYPLKASALLFLLVNAGFKDTKLYGDFKESQWSTNTYATIATAKK
jgi:glycine/sarcosine N-methyltransferase